MTSRFKTVLVLAAFLAMPIPVSQASDRLFTAVPSGDATYVKLKRLEDLGLLPKGASQTTLTRYEVAQLIFRARTAYDGRRGVRLAQAELPPPPDLGGDLPPDFGGDVSIPDFGGGDLPAPDMSGDLPPPPGAEPGSPASDPEVPSVSTTVVAPADPGPAATGPAQQTEPATPSAATGPAQQPEPAAASTLPAAEAVEARAAIGSLEEAYQQELKALKGDEQKLSERTKKLEDEQFRVWKRLRILENASAIYLHGLGRVLGELEAKKGDIAGAQHSRLQTNYLDMNPTGVVSKEIRWSALFRVSNYGVPLNTEDLFKMRRAGIEFNPSWISATMGYFEESYTPLTLWNRFTPDLRYTPEALHRQDQIIRYESFLDHEGYLPFLGLRLGTEVMWPQSNALESWKVSTFAHMITSGYDNGYYDYRFTSWVFGGRTAFKARKYLSLEAQGVMLDEPHDTDSPTSSYQRYDANTWAQRCSVGSIRPRIDAELNRDWTVGAQYELAFSVYQDDKRDSAKNSEGYARLGGPFVNYRRSTLQFNFVDVSPTYYSPLGQFRQDAVTSFPVIDILPRASGFFTAYNRHNDNVFPYGFATPNRKGAGIELGLRVLQRDALQMNASAYQLKENGGNFVMDVPMTGMAPVDGPGNSPAAVRDFTYINVGPKLNLAPLLDLSRDIEIGINYRSEKTESWIGQLKSDGIIAGLRAEILSWWEASVFGSTFSSKGREAFLNGGQTARYSYRFDNRDLGFYTVENEETSVDEVKVATTLKVNRNSRFFLEGYTQSIKQAYPDLEFDSKETNGGGRFIYEIEF